MSPRPRAPSRRASDAGVALALDSCGVVGDVPSSSLQSQPDLGPPAPPSAAAEAEVRKADAPERVAFLASSSTVPLSSDSCAPPAGAADCTEVSVVDPTAALTQSGTRAVELAVEPKTVVGVSRRADSAVVDCAVELAVDSETVVVVSSRADSVVVDCTVELAVERETVVVASGTRAAAAATLDCAVELDVETDVAVSSSSVAMVIDVDAEAVVEVVSSRDRMLSGGAGVPHPVSEATHLEHTAHCRKTFL
eukprot:CAMPEP_0171166534 /NCGR_PEP_ID=MMETSP0790-20130122/6743_1 /TAXON_ID=2925 /ORGANISM="Alexandrium catenella, Strain OF101" /LENGTH=250 /DNA_ID=CAMNT_0011631343 /DNA_START=217 /DNA_END=968 /DNA_ORIENTATION=+